MSNFDKKDQKNFVKDELQNSLKKEENLAVVAESKQAKNTENTTGFVSQAAAIGFRKYIDQQKAECKMLKAQFENLRTDAYKAKMELTRRDNILDTLSLKITTLKDELVRSKYDRHQVKQEYIMEIQKYTQLFEKYAVLEVTYDKNVTNMNKKISELQNNVEAKRMDQISLMEEFANFRKSHDDLLEEKLKIISALNEDLQGLENTLKIIEQHKLALEEDNKNNKESFEIEFEVLKKSHASEIDNSKAQMENKNMAIAQYRNELEKKEEIIALCRQEKAEIEHCKHCEIENYKAEVENMNQAIAQYRDELNKKEEIIALYRQEKAEIENSKHSEIENYKAEMENMNQAIAQYRDELKKEKEIIALCRQEKAEIENSKHSEIENYKAEMESKNEAIAQYNDELKKKEDLIAQFRQEKAEIEHSKHSEIGNYKAEMENMNQAIAQYRDELKKKERYIAMREQKNAEMEARKNTLIDELQYKIHECERLFTHPVKSIPRNKNQKDIVTTLVHPNQHQANEADNKKLDNKVDSDTEEEQADITVIASPVSDITVADSIVHSDSSTYTTQQLPTQKLNKKPRAGADQQLFKDPPRQTTSGVKRRRSRPITYRESSSDDSTDFAYDRSLISFLSNHNNEKLINRNKRQRVNDGGEITIPDTSESDPFDILKEVGKI